MNESTVGLALFLQSLRPSDIYCRRVHKVAKSDY